jgi:serine/threonine protein kinase
MHYLEDELVIHRDLAARNCLIAADSTIKIADFGLSVTQADLELEMIDRGFRAPIRLMSPETISKPPVFSHKSDVWAYGMLLCK